MKSGMRSGAAIAVSGLLASCIFEEDKPSYPPLDKERLIGCWIEDNPGEGFECAERCFTAAGLYYGRANSKPAQDGSPRWVESGGTYTVKGNTITQFYRIGNNVEPPDTAVKKSEAEYTLMRDTLFSITNNGLNLNPFVRADPFKTCGPHWQVFPKPDGWDLD